MAVEEEDDYSWVTDEMFDEALDDVCHEAGLHVIMAIPGVDLLVREEMNNQVLAKLKDQRELSSD